MSPSQFSALQGASPVRVSLCRDRFLLRFESLFHPGRGLSFPCDEFGHVALDQLSDHARENYLFARAVVGHEYATPVVQRCDE
ncbi:hypothetical protein [Roseateles chitosanitabidus]|jgi:hypothetical protein|uniref:hypothetical protein n=1 Tax=Roseateles chitosanitabidus TaxID=65048 RepID=UPI001FDFEFE4|nr:hypothetical protein [Roseateles chitosanitabidus]